MAAREQGLNRTGCLRGIAPAGDQRDAPQPANSIEGGTTEVNKNILAERVLGLPRDTDPWHGKPWTEVPRS